jgi:predicted DNA-binding protein
MATINPRINITVPNEIAIVLNKTARQSKKSMSKVALELIEWAIEEKEDIYFSKIADEIAQSNPIFIPNSEDINGYDVEIVKIGNRKEIYEE